MSISARRVSEETLFGPGASDSMAWHLQRGRAPALVTIADAHELATVGEREFRRERHERSSRRTGFTRCTSRRSRAVPRALPRITAWALCG